MAEFQDAVASLPSRPLGVKEINDLEATERVLAVLYDDEMSELTGDQLFAYNCIFITKGRVTAAVYRKTDRTWYRVYGESRAEATLEGAHDAIRSARNDDELFTRGPITLAEAVFTSNRPSGSDRSGFRPGDRFDCPVCNATHVVKLHEDEHADDFEDLDLSYLYVECPATRRNELTIEFQARTGPEE